MKEEALAFFSTHINAETQKLKPAELSMWGRFVNWLKSFFIETDLVYFGSGNCKEWFETTPYSAIELTAPSEFFVKTKVNDTNLMISYFYPERVITASVLGKDDDLFSCRITKA